MFWCNATGAGRRERAAWPKSIGIIGACTCARGHFLMERNRRGANGRVSLFFAASQRESNVFGC